MLRSPAQIRPPSGATGLLWVVGGRSSTNVRVRWWPLIRDVITTWRDVFGTSWDVRRLHAEDHDAVRVALEVVRGPHPRCFGIEDRRSVGRDDGFPVESRGTNLPADGARLDGDVPAVQRAAVENHLSRVPRHAGRR
jgi:hypothetical protein